jgi:transcriptional regulator with XRE-family HTH domain
MILHAEQIRAARGLLGWSQIELARRAEVAHMAVRRFETGSGAVTGRIESLVRIQDAFERAGVVFQSPDEELGIGVRLKKKPANRTRSTKA